MEFNGYVGTVGRADAIFTPEQLAEHHLTGDERLMIVGVDGNLSIGLAWAERVRITIIEEDHTNAD